MATKYGDFSPPLFNAIGDRYVARPEPGDRHAGLAFMAPSAKTGKTNDACFDRAKVLFEGEKYRDPSRQKVFAVAAKQKQHVSDQPFKMCSPMKVSTGLGDFQGTLQGKVEYIADNPKSKAKKGDYVGEKPNLYTNPGQKGTYGFIKTTISAKNGAAGLQGEYGYAAEPYNRAKVSEKQAKQKKKPVSEAPFMPASPAKRGTYGVIKTNIGNNALGSTGEYSYIPQGAVLESTPAGIAGMAKIETPFLPARAPRKGHNCTLTKFPEYYADPDQIKRDARRRAKRLETQSLCASSPWHPSSVPRIAATRSIVRMNV